MNERFISPCPPPTPVEAEILETLIEECAEVIQRATKMLRFGAHEVQPGQDKDNSVRLALEIGDLEYMIWCAVKADLAPVTAIMDGRIRKGEKFEKYRQHRPAPEAERSSDDSMKPASTG